VALRLAEMVLEVLDERGEQKGERGQLRRRAILLLKAYEAGAEKLGGSGRAFAARTGLEISPEVEKTSLEREAGRLREPIAQMRQQMTGLKEEARPTRRQRTETRRTRSAGQSGGWRRRTCSGG